MNLNLTLFGQMITFAVFVWFTMKYVWPPMMKALADRQKKIAEGIAAAEKSQRDLELAEQKVAEMLKESRQTAAQIIDAANKRAEALVEEAKDLARTEAQRILAHAEQEVNQSVIQAKEVLSSHVGQLVIMTAEKVLRQSIDIEKHHNLIAEAIKEI
ncbi:MAG: F0F1 ATP synthase subunit B [Gammaproteobacteria bacterium]|nr:F0F1 ATP synthase subunit B [Gammaproteobacteria bacterium]MCD8542928.1 F0F1 ATP synthase subunit B [Gammaproteobacteria bacterium]